MIIQDFDNKCFSYFSQVKWPNLSVLTLCIFNVIYKHFTENDKIYEDFNSIKASPDSTNKCKLLEELLKNTQ